MFECRSTNFFPERTRSLSWTSRGVTALFQMQPIKHFRFHTSPTFVCSNFSEEMRYTYLQKSLLNLTVTENLKLLVTARSGFSPESEQLVTVVELRHSLKMIPRNQVPLFFKGTLPMQSSPPYCIRWIQSWNDSCRAGPWSSRIENAQKRNCRSGHYHRGIPSSARVVFTNM